MTINSLKNIALFFILTLVQIPLKAENDDALLSAMKIEADRAKAELKRDSLARPFFISINSNEMDFSYSFFTSFGKQSNEKLDNRSSIDASALVLVGDYHRTQNINTTSFSLPIGKDEKAIRSAIWLNLDGIYKNATRNYVDKMAWLKQENLKPDELELDDFERRTPTVLIQAIDKVDLDFAPIKEQSLKISKLLTEKVKSEKLIVEALTTSFDINRRIYRYYDTEGSMYRYPLLGGFFNIRLSGVSKKGVDVMAYRTFYLNKPSAMPTEDQLKKAVEDIVAEYKVKYMTEDEDNPYMGPVLIVDSQVESVVNQIVNSLYTSPKTRYSNGNHYQNLPGVRIISKQLSLNIAYGKNAQNIEGVRRDLAPIDIQAVIPPDSLVLIKNGLLKNMLTNRQPVKNYKQSNGNAKGNYSRMGGVITLSGNEQYSYEDIKKMLIEEARLQGLEFAYIIDSNVKLHRKVNTETGEEIEFSANFNLGQPMKTMRRVLGVEDKIVTSSDGTIRYPKSILLEDAELTVHKSNDRLKKDFVSRPKI